jgi:hypothetical protein
MTSEKWLLMLYSLPTPQSAERVNLWRKLKKSGAIQLKTSAYILPNIPAHYERFQWLAKQVCDSGGEATLMQVVQIEGLSNEQIKGLFNKERSKDYRELLGPLGKLSRKQAHSEKFTADFNRLSRHFQEIQQIDFFSCPTAQDVQMLFQRVQGFFKGKSPKGVRRDPKHFKGKTWVTRPRPGIDRIGSAWLIRKFIDPKADFIFAPKPLGDSTIPYDMSDVEFTHHGEDCTFETLIKRFGIKNKSVLKISQMIHDADLEDGKFQRTECLGLDLIFRGFAHLGLPDEDILAKGLDCFDALYASQKSE